MFVIDYMRNKILLQIDGISCAQEMKNMVKSNLIPYQDNLWLNITIEQAQFEKIYIIQGQKGIGGPTSIEERRTLVVIALPSIFLN
jgi:hypothetical protein